jgi:hypothetical protein
MQQKTSVITVYGINSDKEISIDLVVVAKLVDAYLTLIPNEKRDAASALRILRLHDAILELSKAEVSAAAKYIEKKTKEEISKQFKEDIFDGRD